MQLQRLERIYYQYFDGLSGENCALIFTFCLFVEKYRRRSSSSGHRTVEEEEEEVVVAALLCSFSKYLFLLRTYSY